MGSETVLTDAAWLGKGRRPKISIIEPLHVRIVG
jgi:hypothetical protein